MLMYGITNEIFFQQMHLLAVHIAKSICMLSKKKNITRRDTEAPRGRQRTCIVSNVKTPFPAGFSEVAVALLLVIPVRRFARSFSFSLSLASCSMFSDRKLPYTINKIDIKYVDTLDESIMV